ncbi:MAG: alpha/beta fold hydrolase [Thermoguttaceae bacterium]|nr:alpha/beta fold hydrolase [Thermoguttaceae bacterium]
MITERYLGGNLAVWTVGRGTPILFVHGFPFDHIMWVPAARSLARCCQSILPDLRGFGASNLVFRDPDEDFDEDDIDIYDAPPTTMGVFADDLASLLDELDIPQVIVCGLSMGGYIAMQFAKKHPRRLKGLILCDTKTEADTPKAAAGRRHLAETVLSEGIEDLSDGASGFLSPVTVDDTPDILEAVQTMMNSQNPAGVAAAALGMAERGDTTAVLQRLEVPVLVVVGQDDRLTPPESMKAMAAKAQRSSFAVIEEGGHLAPMERPMAFEKIVRDWLAKEF